MKKDEIIILGAFRFPDKDAAAKRVYGFGKYLKQHDYTVSFISWCDDENEHTYSKFYDSFKYISLSEFNSGKGSILNRIVRYLSMGNKTLDYLKKIDTSKVKKIIAYHGTSIFLLRLHSFCKERNIELILDITEWYEYSHLKGGKFGLVAVDNMIRMNIINKMIGKMIVISSFLYNFYKERNCEVTLIPFLIDMKDDNKVVFQKEVENTILKLVYIGSPAKKDSFEAILRAIKEINKEKLKVKLDIYGVTLDDFKNNNPDINHDLVNNSYILFHGRVLNKEVESVYSHYHFSILFRPNMRYAKAGFPTKLVESFSYTVPIIASDVGDISNYVINGETGFLVNSLNTKEIKTVINHILKMNNEEYRKMSYSSYEIALKKFDYKQEKKLIQFIKGVYVR